MMNSLVGYGSDDDNDEHYGGRSTVGGHASHTQRRRDDDTNYDDVNMDMSEDSQEAESEPELPPAEPAPSRHSSRDDRRGSGTDDSRERSRNRSRESDRDRDRDRRDRRRESPARARTDRDRLDRERSDRERPDRERPDRERPDRERPDRERPDRERPDRERPDRERPDRDRSERDRPDRDRSERDRPDRDRSERDRPDRRSPRRDERFNRSERTERERGRGAFEGSSRRGLLGDRPDDRPADSAVPPALMDLKPFGDAPPPSFERGKSQDARDAVSPRFVERERRAERERGRHARRSEEKRSTGARRAGRSRSRSRGAAFPPPAACSISGERRGSPPSGDYRPSSYKVNKKLEVMEKMGLQIKTPDGSMATAQQLRAAADAPGVGQRQPLPMYYNPGGINSAKILDQVQKRKLLWSHKAKQEAEAPPAAAQWSGACFAADSDGRQANKFLRLMGIKEPAAVPKSDTPADGMKKQEELFQAMQAQYDVARATTHTMRGVGLGFSRTQY